MPLIRRVIFATVALVLAPCLARPATAQNVLSEEVREFEIVVKDKPAGKSSMRIRDFDDGTTRIVSDVHVKLNYLVYVYRYDFTGDERWRGNRLLSSANHAFDDGKNFNATAESGRGGFRIVANGRARAAATVDMTTNYWRPPELNRDQTLALMNADRGTVHAVKVERLAAEPFAVGSQQITCSHYRLSGDVRADLWFDGQNRIVRQKGIEDGYPTEVRLTRLTRSSPPLASHPRVGARR